MFRTAAYLVPDYTFEVKLFETSSIIDVHILQATTDRSDMTVGIENQAGTAGVQSFHGTGSLSNVAFRYGNIVSPLLVDLSAIVNCVDNTSTVTINASGGIAPYTGTGVFTRGAGLHSFTVTDANGCTAAKSVDVCPVRVKNKHERKRKLRLKFKSSL
jgi:hypothetical protein